MEAIRTLLESPDALKKWLEGKKLGAVVGERETPKRCPLARFLSEEGGLRDVSVSDDYVSFRRQERPGDEDEQVLDLHGWAQSFIKLIDDKDNPHYGVTARTALRCLQTLSTTAP